MTFGELLTAAGVRRLITLPGSGYRATTAAETVAPPALPAPDETCAALLAAAAAELDHGVGAYWDGAVLTLLFHSPKGTRTPRQPEPSAAAEALDLPAAPEVPSVVRPVATPADLLTAARTARTTGARGLRLRPEFALAAPPPRATTPSPVALGSNQGSARSNQGSTRSNQGSTRSDQGSPPSSPASTADSPASTANSSTRATGDDWLARELAGLIGPLAEQQEAPLTPARAAQDLIETLPADAVILAETGPAGLWLDHALAVADGGTPGRARVLRAAEALAVPAALLSGQRGGTVVAVVDSPPVGASATLLHLASALDVGFVVEVWGRRGGMRSAADHRARLRAALSGHGVRVIEVPVDFTPTKLLLDTLTEDAGRRATDKTSDN